MKMLKTMEKYFSKNAGYNAVVHAVLGVGIGILLTYPVVGAHPVRWGVALIVIGLLGHVYAGMQKK